MRHPANTYHSNVSESTAQLKISQERDKTCYQNVRKFVVTLTEDQFTPRNLEDQLHAPEKEVLGIHFVVPTDGPNMMANRNVDPSRGSLY